MPIVLRCIVDTPLLFPCKNLISSMHIHKYTYTMNSMHMHSHSRVCVSLFFLPLHYAILWHLHYLTMVKFQHCYKPFLIHRYLSFFTVCTNRTLFSIHFNAGEPTRPHALACIPSIFPSAPPEVADCTSVATCWITVESASSCVLRAIRYNLRICFHRIIVNTGSCTVFLKFSRTKL